MIDAKLWARHEVIFIDNLNGHSPYSFRAFTRILENLTSSFLETTETVEKEQKY